MLKFDRAEAATVAANTRDAIASYDEAIGAAACLTVSFLSAARDSNMPASESQKLIQALHESAGNVLSGRAGMVSAVSLLASFQRRSNQVETDFGCPGPMPWDSAAQGRHLQVVAA